MPAGRLPSGTEETGMTITKTNDGKRHHCSMKKLALYGYGVFGKRTAESFRFFWGGEYEVTAVVDRDRAGEDDEYWSLRVLSPERIGAEYKKGIFEAVMVCIGDEETRTQLQKRMQQQGIPVFLPGKTEDFAEQGAFREDGTPEITVDRGKYSLLPSGRKPT